MKLTPTNAREYSYSQEKNFAKESGATPTAGSGRFDDKGDSRIKYKFRIDNKATQKSSYSIKLVDLLDLEKHCIGHMEEPIFQLTFLDKDCKELGEYVIMRKSHYLEITNE